MVTSLILAPSPIGQRQGTPGPGACSAENPISIPAGLDSGVRRVGAPATGGDGCREPRRRRD